MIDRPLRLLALVSVWQVLTPFLDESSREAKRGMMSYEGGDWVEAADRFSRANEVSPDATLDYNEGAASYRGQNFDAAGEAFLEAQRSDALPSGEAAFALGNARFRGGDFQGALEAYREALRANPGHEGARYNYELTQRVLEGSPEQPQDQQQQQDSSEQGGEGSQNQDPGSPADSTQQDEREPEPKPGEEQDEEGEKEPRPPEQEGTGEEQEPPPAQQPSGDPDQLLTPEEARKLLDQITPGERELIEQRIRAGKRRRAEKDW